jgi:hypothetical protein
VGTEPERTIVPKSSSASLRTRARALAAQDNISYVAAHARLTANAATSSSSASSADSPTSMPWPDRIVDRDNRGWRHTFEDMYRGYDPSMTMPRPLTDEQLGELAVQPGHPTLTLEETAAVVEHLTLPGIRAFSPDDLAQRVGVEGVTGGRIAAMIERITTEKTNIGGSTSVRFRVDRLGLDARPLMEIDRHFGPWRPVMPMTDADRERLCAAFEVAGRMLIGTVASALAQAHHEACERIGSAIDASDLNPDLKEYKKRTYAHRTLTAGQPGSQQAEEVVDMVRFGAGLVAKSTTKGRGAQETGEVGPNLKRVNVAAREEIAAVLRGWTANPDRYTEVPANLAKTIAAYADATYGAGGWKNIADQWLQPGSRDRVTFARCYFLFYSFSVHFNDDLLL